MKIIAIGDIHMAAESVAYIDGIGSADLVIINGDLTNFGGTREAKQVLDTVLSANQSVLAQFGNLDKPEINDYLEELGLNLHRQARLLNNRVCLIGVGGSNKTPFATPSEFSEEQLAAALDHAYEQARAFIDLAEPLEKIHIPLIMISHTPPFGTAVDQLRSGTHVGSSAVRAFIEERQPQLCICGHIHEAVGSDLIGRTPIYNPGMLSQGGWLEILVDKSTVQTTFHERT
jgi:uncharacterized protein